MIIKEINIDGFGHFSNFSLGELTPGVNLICGRNEAGKSTLLKFLRFTLFGYPTAKNKRMDPLNGGSPAGRVALRLSSGKDLICERVAGAKGGQIKVDLGTEVIESHADWCALIGNANDDLFNNVYTFSLDELTDMESLRESGISDKIFSVGLGLGNLSLRSIEQKLSERLDAIYKVRGSENRINRLAEQIREKEARIEELKAGLSNYQKLIAETREIDAEIEALSERMRIVEKQRHWLDRCNSAYQAFVRIDTIDRELNLLPPLRDYPEDLLARYEETEAEIERVQERKQELETGSADAAGLAVLQRQRDSLSVNRALLERSDEILFLRENRELYKNALEKRRTAKLEIQQLDQVIQSDLQAIGSGWTIEDVAAHSDSIKHRDWIAQFVQRREAAENRRIRIEADLYARKNDAPGFSFVPVFVVAGIVSLILAAGVFMSYGILWAVVLALVTVVFFVATFFNRTTAAENPFEEMLKEHTRATVAPLEAEYRHYLQKTLRLDPALSPTAVQDALARIENAKKNLAERHRKTEDLKNNTEVFISRFEDTAARLTAFLESPGITSTVDFIARAIAEFEESKQALQRRELLDEQIEAVSAQIERTNVNLRQLTTKAESCLAEAEAVDEADFRRRLDDNARVRQLLRDRAAERDVIGVLVGPARVDEVLEYLREKDKSELEAEIASLGDELSAAQERLGELNKNIGTIRQEINSIEGETEQAGLMTELETLKTALNDAYQEWLSGKIALRVLGDVKSKFEREKQPAVIKNSSSHFKRITGGRYEGISVSVDENDGRVRIFDSRDAAKELEALSRGTREQLLICLRLGFIEEYERRAEPLPVVADDILVNFDPERARETAAVFHEFAKDRQILIFTCHESTRDYFNDLPINFLRL